MKKVLLITLAMIASVTFYSCDSNNETDTAEIAEEQNEEKFDDTNLDYDSEFAVKAASGGMMEVELGKLAQTNALSADVKQFGQGMIDDHSKANEELKSWAQSKNITLPTAPNEDHQDKIRKLSEKKGADFDKEYIDFMVDDHKKDIDLFKDQAEKGGDADLRTWAQGKVPTLEHHLMMAEEIKKNLKK